jgi:DnaJ-class molecular chaperone
MKRSELKSIIKEFIKEGEFDDKRYASQKKIFSDRTKRWDSFKEKNQCPSCHGVKLTRPCQKCDGKGYIKEIGASFGEPVSGMNETEEGFEWEVYDRQGNCVYIAPNSREADDFIHAEYSGIDANNMTMEKVPKKSGVKEVEQHDDFTPRLFERTPPKFPKGLKLKVIRRYGKNEKSCDAMWELYNKYGCEKLEEISLGLNENDYDEPERREYERKIGKYNNSNRQRYECPTCHTKDALSAWEKSKGYQCNSCANAEEGPMGGNEW